MTLAPCTHVKVLSRSLSLGLAGFPPHGTGLTPDKLGYIGLSGEKLPTATPRRVRAPRTCRISYAWLTAFLLRARLGFVAACVRHYLVVRC